MVDFNEEFAGINMTVFYKIRVLNKEPSCHKKYMNPFCIKLHIINCPKRF